MKLTTTIAILLFWLQSFAQTPVYILQGTICDITLDTSIENANIKLYEKQSDSINLVHQVRTNDLGFYKFEIGILEPEKDYIIMVEAAEYMSSKGHESTKGIYTSTAFVHEFELQSSKYCQPSWYIGFEELNDEHKLLEFKKVLDDNPTILVQFIVYSNNKKDIVYAKNLVKYLKNNYVNTKRLSIKHEIPDTTLYSTRGWNYIEPVVVGQDFKN